MADERATSTTKKAPVKKAPAKKVPAKKAPAKTAAKKAPATSATTASAKKAPAKAAAKKAPAKKAPAAETPVKKAPAAAKKAPAKKAPAKAPAAPLRRSDPTAPPEADRLKKSPFDKKFLAAQKVLLLEERETLATQAEALKAEADALARDREPGDVQFDDESGEGDTLAVERDFDLARAAAALATIEEIDAAIERIAKGVYGICEYSGMEIPAERLEAIPYARERVEFKTRSFR